MVIIYEVILICGGAQMLLEINDEERKLLCEALQSLSTKYQYTAANYDFLIKTDELSRETFLRKQAHKESICIKSKCDELKNRIWNVK